MSSQTIFYGILSAAIVSGSYPAQAQVADDQPRAIKLPAEPLSAALTSLAQSNGIQVIFSPDLVRPYRSRSINGRLTLDQVLRKLLNGTGLAFRRGAGGTYLIVRQVEPPLQRPQEVPNPPVPDILIVGRLSQNFDIARSANDTQPYDVLDGDRLRASGNETLNALLRTELLNNTDPIAPEQNPGAENAVPRSQINLRGLGASETLILIDGARMPSLPGAGGGIDFLQTDLNPLPLTTINRVEALSATSSGIYGSGAIGGVVNFVLKHDYKGANILFSGGASDRGDAINGRVEARLGFTLNGGRTKISLVLAGSEAGPLQDGDRNIAAASRSRIATTMPAALLNGTLPLNGVVATSISGDVLTFKPAYGAGALNSTFTYLPLKFEGSPADLVGVLGGNAGKLPGLVPPDASGTQRSLITQSRTLSILVNVRQDLFSGVQLVADLIYLRNAGAAEQQSFAPTSAILLASSPGNPFNQAIRVLYPLPGYDTEVRTRTALTRLSGGVIVDLPLGWRAIANLSLGGAGQQVGLRSSTFAPAALEALLLGTASGISKPPITPLGSWTTFLAELGSYQLPASGDLPRHSRFRDSTVKFAGPLATLDGGPMTLSLLAENRRDEVPESTYTFTNISGPATISSQFPALLEQATSLYAELLAPLLAARSSAPELPRVQLQAAIRVERLREGSTAVGRASDAEVHTLLAYTAGVRVIPLPRLMVRASLATGSALPALEDLSSSVITFSGPSANIADPQRGGRSLGSEGSYKAIFGGSTKLPPQMARSISLGIVYNPTGDRGPRLSMDYSRIDERHVLSPFHEGDIAYFVAEEALYPGRVARAPLSAADRQLGFAGGVITSIDATSLGVARNVTETVDFRFDQNFQLGSRDTLAISGAASWEPHLRTQPAPGQPWVERAGYWLGPLRWRASASLSWQHGRLGLGVDGQYFDAYRLQTSSGPPSGVDQESIDLQGSDRIPQQFYAGVRITYRLDLSSVSAKPRSVDLRLSVQNVLGAPVPIVATLTGPQYSTYGDPRGRRFQLSAEFHL